MCDSLLLLSSLCPPLPPSPSLNQNLTLELATMGDLKLVERLQQYTLAPGASKVIRANIKVEWDDGCGVAWVGGGGWVGVVVSCEIWGRVCAPPKFRGQQGPTRMY